MALAKQARLDRGPKVPGTDVQLDRLAGERHSNRVEMESDTDRALRYREHAEALRKVAATILDLKSQQAVIEAAQHYERLAAALATTVQPKNSN